MTKLSEFIRQAAPKYKQTRGALCNTEGEVCVIGMCAVELGLLKCDGTLQGLTSKNSRETGEAVLEKLGQPLYYVEDEEPWRTTTLLMTLNDGEKMTFVEIADALERRGL